MKRSVASLVASLVQQPWLWLLGLSLWLPAVVGAQSGNSQGQAVYAKYCSHCHGEQGDGKGVAAPYLKPQPRDFTSGKYKVRTTPTGALPTDADLQQAIRRGLAYTSMPSFTNLSDAEVSSVVAYIKTFSSDFDDKEAVAEAQPITIPSPPSYTEDSVNQGREVFAATGCARCHGELGRGDGPSAPTLVDDWGHPIRVADLTMPWTFRGGGSRQDIFRTMSTGFNGTPMPGFHGSLPVEDIWSITHYIVSLSGGPAAGDANPEAPYSNLLRAVGTEDELDLSRGKELFAQAPSALFPIVGQVVEPGRNFHPAVVAISAQAVYNRDEIAFRLTWHDMQAEQNGKNGPTLPAPEAEQLGQGVSAAAASQTEGGFWGDEADSGSGGEAAAGAAAAGGFWGDEAEPTAPPPPTPSVAGEGSGDFWGEGDGEGQAAPSQGPASEFSDAVAIQFPVSLPKGVVKPYILFGDAQNPVELWFADLSTHATQIFIGRGSAAITPGEDEPPAMVAQYEQGEWSVTFKRERKSRSAISFDENTFVPIAFSVWDGWNRERGNRRGLTAWYDLYLVPLETPSPLGPMAKAGLGLLGLELLIIALVRRKFGKTSQ